MKENTKVCLLNTYMYKMTMTAESIANQKKRINVLEIVRPRVLLYAPHINITSRAAAPKPVTMHNHYTQPLANLVKHEDPVYI